MDYVKNDRIVISIEDIGAGGEGIGKLDGFPFFVKDALPGETVEAIVTKVKKSYGYARLEKVCKPSPFRVEAKCRFYRQCGGCQIQALSYEKQLEWKQRKVKEDLIRIGGFAADEIERVMEAIVGMEEPYRYRNKAQFPIGTDKSGRLIAGFYAGRTHSIIANTDCALGVLENREILETVLDYMRKAGVSAYEEKTGRGLVRHVLIRKGFASGELMVCLVVNARELPRAELLVEALRRIPHMTSISYSVNQKNTNVIMGEEIVPLWGRSAITDRIGDITFLISPLSFYQVNPLQTKKLYELAAAYAQLDGTETVWDLYCGIGTISLFLAKRARRVYGVEVVEQAVRDARANASLNGIENAEFFCGRAEEILPEKYAAGEAAADVVVVDPPRKGCDELCLSTILRLRPKRIVYVSCDPATLARDLKILRGGGYALRRVRAVDQFPHTVHIETVCLLSKLNVEQHIEVEVTMEEMG